VGGQPLRFAVEGDPQHCFVPYWQVGKLGFACFPVIETIPSRLRCGV